ncbi:MAG: hypothetical protein RMJ33_13255 [Saprospiraceae bacterium]|nr:hypothetical protein [Saprospiraceae bacterium]MDW8230793.1 hypothetical protein [Saprospiraceae bacterium]
MPAILCPFFIEIEPMERLLLINFEKDPDTLYVGFEPQVFDDALNGKGHLVVGWRRDGKVDVYHEPTVTPQAGKYDIAGKGLAEMRETHFEEARYTLSPTGVSARYVFTDVSGRRVEIRVEEKSPKRRRPFALLAPMGAAAEKPSALPLIWLFDFYFVRRKNTDFEVAIDGNPHQPDRMPIWLDGASVLFTRYSSKPVISRFNPNYDGELPVFQASGENPVTIQQQQVYLSRSAAGTSIEKIVYENPIAPIELRFEPPFPNLYGLSAPTAASGKFEVSIHASAGCLAGDYWVSGDGDRIRIRLTPSGGWKPRPDRFVLWFLYTVAKVFKNWPKTYVWEAEISRKGEDYYMKSQWSRTR